MEFIERIRDLLQCLGAGIITEEEAKTAIIARSLTAIETQHLEEELERRKRRKKS